MAKKKEEEEIIEMQEQQQIEQQKKKKLEEEQVVQQQQKPAWMKKDTDYTFKFLGKNVSKKDFEDALTSTGVQNFKPTPNGCSVDFAEGNTATFDAKANTVTMTKLDRETFKKVAKITKASGVGGFDLSQLALDLQNDKNLNDKERKDSLYNAYAGAIDAKLEVKGIDNLMQEFEQRLSEEQSQKSTIQPHHI